MIKKLLVTALTFFSFFLALTMVSAHYAPYDNHHHYDTTRTYHNQYYYDSYNYAPQILYSNYDGYYYKTRYDSYYNYDDYYYPVIYSSPKIRYDDQIVRTRIYPYYYESYYYQPHYYYRQDSTFVDHYYSQPKIYLNNGYTKEISSGIAHSTY